MKLRRTTSADALQSLPHEVATHRRSYGEGYVSSLHSHTRHQLVYAVSGLYMAQADCTTWAVPAGSGLVVPAHMPHEVRMSSEVQMRSLYVDVDAPGAEAMTRCRVVSVSALLACLINELSDMENPWPMPPKARHLIQLILIELAEASETPLALPYPSDARLRQVCDALVADPALVRSIDHWVDDIGMSRRSFTRKFQLETGLSFGKWQQRLRCHAAMKRLAQRQPMARVAQELGYASSQSLREMMQRLV